MFYSTRVSYSPCFQKGIIHIKSTEKDSGMTTAATAAAVVVLATDRSCLRVVSGVDSTDLGLTKPRFRRIVSSLLEPAVKRHLLGQLLPVYPSLVVRIVTGLFGSENSRCVCCCCCC